MANMSPSFSNIMTNEQKKDWFLRLDPNGRIPILIDHTQSPPFPVMETSAELLYLLKFADKNDVFGFKDELERSQALQWLFFWHGSGAPYQVCPHPLVVRASLMKPRARQTILQNLPRRRSLVRVPRLASHYSGSNECILTRSFKHRRHRTFPQRNPPRLRCP